VPLLFGSGWTPMVPIIKLLALSWAVSFPFILTPPALKSKGRPDILLWFGLKRGFFALSACVATSGLPPVFGAAGWAVAMTATAPWSMVQLSRHVGISIRQQIHQLIPSAIATALMFLTIEIIQHLERYDSSISRLILAVAVGGIVYLLTIWSIDPVLRKMIRPVLVRMKRLLILAPR
jgi:O-antigen/teichoic acid export membrane protein